MGQSIDDRGVLSYVNIMPNDVKRMYVVENFSTDTIRAFHGHLKERKYVYVVSGSALVITAEMHDGELADFERFVLSAREPRLLTIQAGYANGWRALEPNTKIIFFSTTTLEDAVGDDYRFPHDWFGREIWESSNR